MAKEKVPRRDSGQDLQRRLTALAGLVVIVGGTVAVLFFTGVLGSQGGGTTETGIKIEDALGLDPPRATGVAGLANINEAAGADASVAWFAHLGGFAFGRLAAAAGVGREAVR